MQTIQQLTVNARLISHVFAPCNTDDLGYFCLARRLEATVRSHRWPWNDVPAVIATPHGVVVKWWDDSTATIRLVEGSRAAVDAGYETDSRVCEAQTFVWWPSREMRTVPSVERWLVAARKAHKRKIDSNSAESL